MENTLFLQSEVENPYDIYMHKLNESPEFHDTKNDVVAVYSYENCRQILNIGTIPPVKENGLNEAALLIKKNLARISNPPAHADARKAAVELFHCMRPVNIKEILNHLLCNATEFDWVERVSKKLPLLYLLKSFGFTEEAIHYFFQNIESLTKIISPNRTAEQENDINNISEKLFELIKLPPLYVSNLAGLIIQSYDATRGLLSNALLQILRHHQPCIAMKNKQFFLDAVTETMRFDPPVHNTRRIVDGKTVLVVLAAANRDPTVFYEPGNWNIARENNQSHLGFGIGPHACLAHHWAVKLTADALFHLFNKYPVILLAEKEIIYEPLVNLRLPCSLRLNCLL